MSEPNDAQAVIAGVLSKHRWNGNLLKICKGCNWPGLGANFVDHQAEMVDAALGRLAREHSKATRNCNYPGSDGPCVGKHHGRWVSDWTPEEAGQ